MKKISLILLTGLIAGYGARAQQYSNPGLPQANDAAVQQAYYKQQAVIAGLAYTNSVNHTASLDLGTLAEGQSTTLKVKFPSGNTLPSCFGTIGAITSFTIENERSVIRDIKSQGFPDLTIILDTKDHYGPFDEVADVTTLQGNFHIEIKGTIVDGKVLTAHK